MSTNPNAALTHGTSVPRNGTAANRAAPAASSGTPLDTLLRILAALGMTALTAGALYVSYLHCLEFVSHYGVTGASAYIVAGTVDGIILMAGITIAAARRQDQPVPFIAHAALALGLIGTGIANAWSGASHGWVGIAVGLWVPIVLEVAYQLLMWIMRGTSQQPHEQHGTAAEPVDRVDAPHAADTHEPVPEMTADDAAFLAALGCDGTTAAQPAPARHIHGTAVPLLDTRDDARQVYRAALDAGTEMTGKALAARYGKSERWGRQRITECREPALSSAIMEA